MKKVNGSNKVPNEGTFSILAVQDEVSVLFHKKKSQ